jgi:dihydrodipicolinate synthase/N-acetylneuraminate lyase
VTHASEPTLVTTHPIRLTPPVLLAASITPLRSGGAEVDEGAIGPLAEFHRDNGADGVFACGTTGEGLLLTADERLRVARRFREAIDGPLILNAGCQTTAATCYLAARAVDLGVDGVAVVPPPYYPLDAVTLSEHMIAAACACAPAPFYMYIFTVRSGYPFPVEVIDRVRDRAENLVGLKVSEASMDSVAPYIATGLDVLVGQEMLVPAAMRDGAVGAASGMAAAFPAEVSRVVRGESPDGRGEMQALRARLDALGGMIPGLKAELGRLGLPVQPDVRAPLRRGH